MERISKDRYYVKIAEQVFQRSTCLRRHYGAIIVAHDEIIATGYNGAPRGMPSCLEKGYCWREDNKIPHGTSYEKCYHENTVIKLLNGKYKTIKQLAEENKDVWVYSYNTNTGKIVPAVATNARKTGYRSDLIEIIFDNNKSIICTSDEKLLLRNGKYKEVKDIKHGDSLMPMYYRVNFNGATLYEHISNTIKTRVEGKSRTWKKEYAGRTYSTPTHKLIYEFLNGAVPDNLSIHHIDEDSLNNDPDNFKLVLKDEHTKYHIRKNPINKEFIKEIAKKGVLAQRKKLLENKEFRKFKQKIGSQNMLKNWNNEKFKSKMKKTQYERSRKGALASNSNLETIKNRQKSKILAGISYLFFRAEKEEKCIDINNYENIRDKYKRKRDEKGSRPPKIQRILKYFSSLEEALTKATTYNHKVIKTIKLNLTYPVYDITVNTYHNFAIALGDNSCIFGHNCYSVHAEENAMLSAARRDMLGSTMYIVGENKDFSVCSAMPCPMCLRKILNSGIETVKYRTVDNNITVVHPQIDWSKEEYLVTYKG